MVESTKPLSDDVWLFLAPDNMYGDISWTFKAKCDELEINWLRCLGAKGDWNDKFFNKPDDTDLGPAGKQC